MEGNGVLSSYLSKKKGLLICSGLLSVISTFAQFIPFYCIYKIIELLMIGSYQSAEMVQWSLYAILSVLLSMVFLYVSSMCSHVAAFNILYEIRIDLAQHLSKIPIGYYTEHSSGQMIKTIDQCVEKIESFVAHQIPDIVSAVVFPLGYIIVLAFVDWRLTLVSLIPVIIAVILYIVLMSSSMKDNKVKQYHDSLEEMNSNGVEYIRAMPAVKIFGLNVNNFKRFHKSIQDYKKFVVAWTKDFRNGYILFTALVTSVALFVMPFGVFLLSQDPQNQSLALTIMLFIIVSSGMSAPFMKLMYAASTYSNVAEGVKRVDEMFQVKEVEDLKTDIKPETNEIEFKNVHFSYTDDTEVLSNVNFLLKENSINALVGPSGGGKSTIAQLLLRFYDVNKGKITIGGKDIRNLSIERLMQNVSFVFQDVTLFNDTIEENIRMGNQEASQKEIEKVARMARCHEFIENLPKGYQTKIGEHGVYLSAGESQRVSIARALLKNAPILVLDEATAYADAENEIYIQQAINELIKDKTVLIIAHRLWTIRHVAQILVCDKGQIIASDTHENLLNTCDLYKTLWSINTETTDWKVREEHA